MSSRSYGVVICSHNRLNYLQRTMEYFQNSPDVKDRELQIVLADDKSTDNTIEWAEKSGLFSAIFKNNKNGTYCLNTIRNGGISLCSSSHIILLDCDCKPVDGFLLGHDAVFDEFPNAISVGFTDRYDINAENAVSHDVRRSLFIENSFANMGWSNAYGGNIAFPLSLWETLGGFDEEFDGAWGFEDLDFSYRAKKLGFHSVAHIKTVVRHMQHPILNDAQKETEKNINLFEKKHKIRF